MAEVWSQTGVWSLESGATPEFGGWNLESLRNLESGVWSYSGVWWLKSGVTPESGV